MSVGNISNVSNWQMLLASYQATQRSSTGQSAAAATNRLGSNGAVNGPQHHGHHHGHGKGQFASQLSSLLQGTNATTPNGSSPAPSTLQPAGSSGPTTAALTGLRSSYRDLAQSTATFVRTMA